MSHLQLVKQNGKPRSNTFKPVLVPRPEEQAAAYETALELVAQIDDHLTNGTRHYRAASGELLRTLDQVVNAILDDTLVSDVKDYGYQRELAWAA
ncbi:MAG TPA: hypothetical protein G4N96_11575 [Chloroflexi bacterium]|nr:MAG: hypothetical protein B6243_13300 [Anaerolineaceae bacterium 4572_5.2]HEY85736.1 hypothetical protein [Chloroflexota bacterium]